MDYPFLNAWIDKTARSETALMNLVTIVLLACGFVLLIQWTKPHQGDRLRFYSFMAYVLASLLVMAVLR